MRFTQVLVGAGPGDAVTRSAMEIDRLIAPHASTALRARYVDPALAGVVTPLLAPEDGPPASSEDIVLLHVSIGEPDVTDWLAERPERLVVMYHNISPAESFEAYDPAFADLLRLGRAEIPALADRAEVALAVSAFNAAELTAMGFADVKVCPLVFDPWQLARTVPSPSTARHLREVTTGPVVLYVGQLLPHKRVDWLLEAYFILVTYLIPEAHLIVVGPDPLPEYHDALRRYCDELNLDRTWLTGRVSDADLAAFYHRADVVATASEHEGFCAPLLEAMAFDVPVVARRFAAIPETLGDGGLLVGAEDPPAVFAEALADLVTEPGRALRRTLTQGGHRRLDAIGPEVARATLRQTLAELVPGLNDPMSEPPRPTAAVTAPRRSVPLRVGFLVPRYGLEIIGGAEYGARMIAEHLAADGCEVEVFTSRGLEAKTWADTYPEGTVEINGVTVHRFSATPRHPDFDELSQPVLADPPRTSMAATNQWIDRQGPVFPAGLDAAAASAADVIVAYPYLYWPTIEGVRRLGRRVVLQPAAHDEPPIRLPIFREVFTNNGGIMYQTSAERRLVERLFPESVDLPQALIGLGVEPAPGDSGAARRALGLGDRPYLLCVGRVDEHKGTTFLAEWWAGYKQRHPGPLALVYLGPVADLPLPHPDLIVAGIVDEAVKWGAMRGATALVSPSPFEAFSLVLLESWAVGVPVMVNAFCGPTAEHCANSGGGVAFGGYAAFEATVDALVADPALGQRLGANGAAYVDRLYRWPVLTTRYRNFLQLVADRRPTLGRS